MDLNSDRNSMNIARKMQLRTSCPLLITQNPTACLAESAGKNFKYIILRCEDKGEELKPAIAAWRNIVQAHCYFVKDEIRLEYLPGMNLISGRQVVCLCNDRNKTVPWQEYINPAKEQFLSCPKAKIRFFPVIDPENSWLLFWSLNFMCMSKSQAGEVVES